MTTHAENALMLADFIESDKHPWNIRIIDQCFFGQYVALTGDKNPNNIVDFLGLKSDNNWASSYRLTQPEGYYRPENYPRERAVKLLRNLAATGEVIWQ